MWLEVGETVNKEEQYTFGIICTSRTSFVAKATGVHSPLAYH